MLRKNSCYIIPRVVFGRPHILYGNINERFRDKVKKLLGKRKFDLLSATRLTVSSWRFKKLLSFSFQPSLYPLHLFSQPSVPGLGNRIRVYVREKRIFVKLLGPPILRTLLFANVLRVR